VTTQNKFFGLDHLRALAIIMVFIYHYGRLFPHPEWTNVMGKFGWTGVDLFFVLSGYLISSQLFSRLHKGREISVKKFYLKRFFRIIPVYLFIVAVYFCFPQVREREALAPIWKYLTFTQNYGLDLRRQGTFSHAWSLCIEEQFYFCLPLIFIGMQRLNLFRKGYRILIGFMIAGIVIRFLSYTHFITPLINTDDAVGIYWYKWIYYTLRIAGLMAYWPGLELQPYSNSGQAIKHA
jgi:peptidoglycan/LPS O-acetylase OafA/YrhL